MLSDVGELLDDDADEATWKTFQNHYDAKWDKYNKAVNKKSSYQNKQHKYRFDRDKQSSSEAQVQGLASYDDVVDGTIQKRSELEELRQAYTDQQLDEYTKLVQVGASQREW